MIDKKYYRKLYDRVGKNIGWDFRHLGETKKGRKWDFFQEVAKKVKEGDVVLDLGTGGGERVLEIADKIFFLIGIDFSSNMVNTARKNLSKKALKNVRFLQMDSSKLIFPDNFFDIVTSRHCDFSAKEVYRVLKKGGYFLTQQVSEYDKINIKKEFGRGQAYGKEDGSLKKRYLGELKKMGFKKIKSGDYDSTEFYRKKEDIVYLLKYSPIIPHFGKKSGDSEKLEKFFEKYTTKKGVKTNSKRIMITAQK